MKTRYPARLTLACLFVWLFAAQAAGKPATAPQTFNLADFGAVGDGVTDDGPALQAALDAVVAAGGGTLLVPAGRFAIATPVELFAPAPNLSVEIRGVPSSTVVPPPTAGGDALSRGLYLQSEFAPKTGAQQITIHVAGFRSFLIQDICFIGSPEVAYDALITLAISNIPDAVIRHCEFYGLMSESASIVQNWASGLTIQQSWFLGCTANSGLYAPVVQNLLWESITVEDTIFIDYGQRPELYAKTGYGSPLSWINVGHAAPPTPDSPRREVVLRNLFLDEGGWIGLSVMPARYQSPPVPIDLFYATGFWVNVSNFFTAGLYITGVREAVVEDSLFTYSRRADAALQVHGAQDAILDRVRTELGATRLFADYLTQRLTVIDSTYTELASDAAQTIVLNPATPDDDPVRYVRARFQSALGRAPDAAAHYYWSRKLLDCGADSACVTSQRAALAAYLAQSPAATFAITGRATDEAGRPLAGVTVTLTGTHLAATVAATTGADGSYRFGRLPTSDSYTVTASPKRHYTFTGPASRTVVTPAGAQTIDFPAALNRHSIGGRLLDERGRAIQGAALTLSGGQAGTTTSDANGNYSFASLPAGRDYTVTASSTRHSFALPSQSLTDLDADKTADFSGTSLFYNITGQVVDLTNKPVAGLSVALSGGKTAAAVTDPQGNFTFVDVPRGGSYTVTPGKLFGNLFTPASEGFANLTADQSAVFTAVPTDYRIAGRVTSGGAGVAGATMTLAGSKQGTATTDAAGAYSFSVPAHGDYTVAPSHKHYTFDRASASFTAVTSDRTADFVATLNRHKISGAVKRPDGAAMAGVTVALSGGQAATATTDASGAYSFASLPAGLNYTVTPSRAGYDFAPASKSFTDLGADSAADFTVTPANIALSGRVTAEGSALAGVTVALTGAKTGTATTDAQGNYSFTVTSEGGYTVTPSKAHYKFAPSALTFNNPTSAQTADFVGTLDRHKISGRVTDKNNAAMAGVTVALSGAQTATATTDAQGNFSFPNLAAGGGYTLTPALAHHTFAPASQRFDDLSADASAAFTASVVTRRVAGLVREKGAPLAGVEVTLDGTHAAFGAQAGKATTGADGAYSFTVPAGGDYTVAPSKKNYVFDPAAATFKALASDMTADFSARLQAVLAFTATSYTVAEGGGSVSVTVTREGDTTTEASFVYEGHGDTAKPGSDFVASIGLVTFAPGETSKTFALFITDDSFVEGPELFTLTLKPSEGAVAGDAAVASVTINDNDTDATPSAPNPIDADEFFVTQHYRDFFSREPDAPGLKFWTDEIKKCGTDAQCREARRISVSAAFFLSIEFRETGLLVYRLYRAAYGRVPTRVGEFMLDSRMVGDGVVVGAVGWEERLAANKRAFLAEWTTRPEFEQRFAGLDDSQFLQALFTNMGVTPTDARRAALLAKLASGAARAEVLAEVIDDEQFNRLEFNRAFVLMQYFGYLRRNPSDPPDSDLSGYNHWLGKLNDFGGDYQKAEMVKAFLSSTEYRGRFGN